MKIWYLEIAHIPIAYGKRDGPDCVWCHGREESSIPKDDMTEDWLRRNGYRSPAAAKRAANTAYCTMRDEHWDLKVDIKSVDVRSSEYHAEIIRCYEIVIRDRKGNQIGDCNYCYGTKADAEKMAGHELKIAEMDLEVR